jgi:hypothetical protein
VTTWRATAPSSFKGRRGRWPPGFAPSLLGPRGVRASRPRKCSYAKSPKSGTPLARASTPVRAPVPGARTLHTASAAPGATSSSERLRKGDHQGPSPASSKRSSYVTHFARLHAAPPSAPWSSRRRPRRPSPRHRPGTAGARQPRPAAPAAPGRGPVALKRKRSSLRRAAPRRRPRAGARPAVVGGRYRARDRARSPLKARRHSGRRRERALGPWGSCARSDGDRPRRGGGRS